MEKKSRGLLPVERIERCILLIRGEKVLLDADLAEMYGVETKVLTRAVRRNIERFPEGFMFRLSAEEFEDLRRQFGASSQWGGRRYDDGTPASCNGLAWIHFDREAASLEEAITSAVAQVQGAGFKVSKVELDVEAAAAPRA